MNYSSDEDDKPIVFKRSSNSDKLKHSAPQKMAAPVKPEKKPPSKPIVKQNSDSDNSEDDKPLSSRISSVPNKPNSTNHNKTGPTTNASQHNKTGPTKNASQHTKTGPTTSASHSQHTKMGPTTSASHSQHTKMGPTTSVSQYTKTGPTTSASHSQHTKTGPTTSASQRPKPQMKKEDSDDEKPLSVKVKQNGTLLKDEQIRKPNIGLNNKRPPNEEKSLGQSSVKKPKLSDSATPISRNSVPVKPESVKKPKLSDSATPISRNPVSVKPESVEKPKLSDSATPISRNPVSVKPESDSDDDDENDNVPISQRIKNQTPSSSKSSSVKQKSMIKVTNSSSFKKSSKKIEIKSKYSKPSKVPPGSGEGQKWTTLVHNGVIFPPPYKPHGVKILYKGKPVDLTPEQEEVATMFAVMLEADYMNKRMFKENFWSDWRKILGKNHVIQNLDDCDFSPIFEWHKREKEKKKQMSTEEKKAIKEEKMQLEEKYMWAIVDGVKEKVGNFRVEPPGLFRGRGEHPKMGKLKKRICPSDITINIGKGAPIPECPIPGQSWKEVRHDNTVTWLAYWNDPINPKDFKYVFLAASSSLKGQSDMQKYQKARKLKEYIEGIRKAYTRDFGNKDETKKQVAVATYLIDKLALRAGNEKDDDEADTVGCCTLKVENVEPEPPNILKFDFLGKDSIRYQNEVEVELPVFKAIQEFRKGKKGGDDLFDKLDTSTLNAHLKELMPELTAKVFRTYNASITLDDMLNKDTKGGNVAENVVIYNQANKQVAIICNHQRTVSKSHSAQMTRLNEKIEELKGVVKELETDLSRAKKGKPPLMGSDGKTKRNMNPEALQKKIDQTHAKIEKMERDKETKEDLKTVALGTSKINYLDPRITVAWCKRSEVPIEKIFNKSLLAKFSWAMNTGPDFRF